MDGRSESPKDKLLSILKQEAPAVFSENKVDWEKLKATLGEDINFANERYVLNWAGKSEAFKALQTPSTKTLIPAKDESINFEETENIFIEGENLEVLKVLQKSYFGKVKMIYIDPPYNTGNDSFIYPDSFSETKAEYQKRVGDKDEEGYMTKQGMFHKNSKEGGQYHSNWLNMMYPRLFLAKNLMKADGVIFVSIDDNEVHNLKLLMNEVFGEENFAGKIIWQKSKKGDSKLIATVHEYILCYVKSKQDVINNGVWRTRKEGVDDVLEKYQSVKKKKKGDHAAIRIEMMKWFKGLKDNDLKKKHKHYNWSDDRGLYFPDNFAGPDDGRKNRPRHDIFHPITKASCKKPSTGWRWDEKKTNWALSEKPIRIHFGIDETTVPNRKSYLKETALEPFSSVFYQDGRSATLQVESLLGDGVFQFPKNTAVLSKLIDLVTQKDDIIFDFFGGSGSFAHACYEQNKIDDSHRKFLLVQLPELCNKESEAYKAEYMTIADIAKERIRKTSSLLKKEKPNYKGDLGFKVLKLSDSNFKQWKQIQGKDAKALEEQMKLFVDPVSKKSTTENMVYELLLKSGKDINSKLEDKKDYYTVNDNEMILLLSNVSKAIIDKVIKANPKKVIALDKLFKENDQLKTNASLQMKDAGIEFKTI